MLEPSLIHDANNRDLTFVISRVRYNVSVFSICVYARCYNSHGRFREIYNLRGTEAPLYR